MILGTPQLQNCIINISKKQMNCNGKIISLKSIYELPTVINNITTEQMHTLLQDYYEGDLKKLPFIRSIAYSKMNNREKREWLNRQLDNYKNQLLSKYHRSNSSQISQEFIQTLWERQRKALQIKKGTMQRYELPDGTSTSEKTEFYKWIQQIFDAPLQIRTGKYPWENKELPSIPIQQENLQEELQPKFQNQQNTEKSNNWINKLNQKDQQRFNSLQEEYLFVKNSNREQKF